MNQFDSASKERWRHFGGTHSDMHYSSVEYVASRHNHPLLLTLLQARASPTTAPTDRNDGSLRAINPLVAAILPKDSRTMRGTLNQESQYSFPESVFNVVRTLVENGADVNSVHPYSDEYRVSEPPYPNPELRRSAICAAAYKAYSPVVTYLLDQGAEVHRGSRGQYALLSLTENLNHCNAASAFEIAKTLIDKGVDVSITCPEELTALDYAIEHKSSELIELLQSEGATCTSKSLNHAISTGSTQLVHQILDSMFLTKNEKLNPLDFLPTALMVGMDHIAPKLLNLALTAGHAWPSREYWEKTPSGFLQND